MSPLLGIIDSSKLKIVGSFDSIASASGTGSSTTITFSSIPSTYQHLQIRYMAKDVSASTTMSRLTLRFNGVTTSNYHAHYMQGNSTTINGGSNINKPSLDPNVGVIPTSLGSPNLANIFGVGIIDIHNYTATGQSKAIRYFAGLESNNTLAVAGISAVFSGFLNSTSAISSIELINSTNNWTSTSRFALYGIKG